MDRMDRNYNLLMKSVIYILILCETLLLISCRGEGPTKSDIVGTWISKDSAVIQFKDDGTFIAKSLPGEHFIHSLDEEWKDFDGEGIWKFIEGKKTWETKPWEIKLEFHKINNQKVHFGYIVYISGSNVLENKPPWRLFVWEYNDIDALNRYEFKKQ